jgi:hypothetical protein
VPCKTGLAIACHVVSTRTWPATPARRYKAHSSTTGFPSSGRAPAFLDMVGNPPGRRAWACPRTDAHHCK